MIAPTLQTERLRLRMPVLSDFGHRAAFHASDRSIWEGGAIARAEAWHLFASEVGQWALMGFGPFLVEDRESGAHLGETDIYQPQSYPEPELGWFVLPEAEGRGIAAEAARAVMLWARQSFGWDRLVNYIHPDNARSIALGLRLGGQITTDLPGDVVIVHDLRGLA